MLISAVACDGNSKKHAYVVGAQYKDGLGVFSTYISDAVSRYLSHTELRSVSQPIIINGEVGENGAVINLKYDSSYKEDIARGLVRCLKDLPALHPATGR